MKRAQIKELAQSIAGGGFVSEKDAQWILNNFSRGDLKIFTRLLTQELKDKKVTASYAGNINEKDKERIISLFPDKDIEFNRDDENLGAGIKLEYRDFVLDYSVSGIIKRILNNIRESL
jgi:F-type H+-transporting ATPase subunit delta